MDKKILIVVDSTHLRNTMKIATAMGEAVVATITNVEGTEKYRPEDFDLVGYGSGIYFGKHSKKLMELVEKQDDGKANVFVFSTSGTGNVKNNGALEELLKSKNKAVLGSFCCKGHDKFAMFKLVGGLNKGRPDDNDLENARQFIMDVVKKYEERL